MRFYLHVVLLILALWPGTRITAQVPDQSVRLQVKPVLCITDTREQDCELSFLVRWQSDVQGFYCLYNDFTETPLECWEHHDGGSLEEGLVVDRSFYYWLTGRNIEVRLAESLVEVVTLESSDRRQKRRRRHAWSIL